MALKILLRGRRARPLALLLLPLLLPLLTLTGACGLAPHDLESTSIPSDGVSGFGEASPIELCVGTARVVPSSAPDTGAGVCIRKGATGPSCAADSSCAGIERCICGRCIVEACQGAASCSGGRVCRGKRCTTSCSSDAACAQGERCISGGCALACSSDAACRFGERCDALDGACAAKLCGGALACGPVDSCELERVAGEVHEPSLAVVSDRSLAFFEIRGGGAALASGIYRAFIDAPERWTADPPAPVLAPLPGEIRVGAPSALVREGGSIELYFAVDEGSAIARAVSSDGGASFDREVAPILAPADPWEAGRLDSPSVVERDGHTYLFYEGGLRAGIGLARIDDGSASRLLAAPIAAPSTVEDAVLWRGITEIGSPHAIIAGGVLRLYFTARGAEAGDALSGDTALPADRNDSIGLLTSRDLAAFEPYPTGPVFSRVANLRAYLGEREAFVALPASGAEITFLASDASGDLVSGLARAVAR